MVSKLDSNNNNNNENEIIKCLMVVVCGKDCYEGYDNNI